MSCSDKFQFYTAVLTISERERRVITESPILQIHVNWNWAGERRIVIYLAVLKHQVEDLPHWFRKDVSDVARPYGSRFCKDVVESDLQYKYVVSTLKQAGPTFQSLVEWRRFLHFVKKLGKLKYSLPQTLCFLHPLTYLDVFCHFVDVFQPASVAMATGPQWKHLRCRICACQLTGRRFTWCKEWWLRQPSYVHVGTKVVSVTTTSAFVRWAYWLKYERRQ